MLHYAALTHPGRKHRENQDAILVRDRIHQKSWRGNGLLDDSGPLLAAVADGVSSSVAPATASRSVLSALRDSVLREPHRPVRYHADVVHDRLCGKLKRAQRGMASTLVAAIVRGPRAVVFNAGDSRAYLLSAGHARLLSRDHTTLQRMLDHGEITPAQAASAASFYNGLESCFIADTFSEPPELCVREIDLLPGTALLLCSDGLTHFAPEGALAAAWSTPEATVEALFSAALEYGSDDDISLVILAAQG